jgi:WD40 repeat protein
MEAGITIRDTSNHRRGLNLSRVGTLTMRFNGNGHYIVTQGQSIRVAATFSGQDLAIMPLEQGYEALGVSAGGRYLSIGHPSTGRIEVWETQPLHRHNAPYLGKITEFDFGLDGDVIYTKGYDNDAIAEEDVHSDDYIYRLWDWRTSRLLEEWRGNFHKQPPSWVSSFEERIMSKKMSQEALKQELQSKGQIPQADYRTRAALNPNQDLVVIGGSAIRIKERISGKEIASIPFNGWVTDVGFDPTGKIVIAAVGASLKGWRWQIRDLHRETCTVLADNLASAVWRKSGMSLSQLSPWCDPYINHK